MSSLEQLCDQAVKDGVYAGAVMCSKDRSGKFNYAKAFGKTSLDANAPDMALDTVFQIASMTKLMASIAALQVVEQGKIKLDDDVSSIIPEIADLGVITGFNEDGSPKIDKRKNALTLRHLLTHSAGCGYDAWTPQLLKYRAWQKRSPNTGTTFEERFTYPLVYEPGTSWIYSTSIDWTGRVVEKLTGQTLDDYLRANVWDPLGIKNITFWPDKQPGMRAKVAGLTARDPKSGKVVPHTQPFLNDGSKDCFGGHGAFATMEDYVKILHSILVDDEKILKKETTAQMFKPQLTKESKAALNHTLTIPEVASMFIGDWPTTVSYDWGLGGILVEDENQGRRKRNTLIWSGLPNLFWFIDREAGLCGVFGTQVVPPGDIKVEESIKAFEFAMNERMQSAKL